MRSSRTALLAVLALAVLMCLPEAADAKRRKRPPKKPVATESEGKSGPQDPQGGAAPAEATAAKEGAGADAAAPKTRVVVLPVAGLGIDSDTLASLEQYLRNSIATIEGTELINPVDLQIALRKPANAEVASCGGGPKCAQQAGAIVQAQVVVFGTIGAVGDAFSLNLRALEVASGKEIARQRTSIAGTRHLLIPEMRLAAYRLIAPDKIRGSLLVEIDVEGVEVEIDGTSVGTTPLKNAVSLTPGSHVVVLKRQGYSSFQQEFEIKPFDTARLQLDLRKAQPN